jgi:hypothetical protein
MVVPGDAVGLGLAEELERLRPFGMGNPGVNLLVPAARVTDVQSMGEGRHARFTVTSAGVGTRAVAFGVGSRLMPDGEQQHRHDLIGRLEANEWRGTVEPRLVLNSLHALESSRVEVEEAVADSGCARCDCRARGAEWWESVWSELEADIDGGPSTVSALAPRTIVDLRGRGIIGSLSDLLSTGESLAVVCADVSRRRELLDGELDAARFGRSRATVLSARCGRRALELWRSAEEAGFGVTDHATAAGDPSLLARFTHVFALDPPPFEAVEATLRAGAPVEGGFLHLGWGSAELDFTRKAVEQEYGLRGPLAAIYRELAKHPEGLSDDSLEAVLAGAGRHSRPPAVVGRCLRVLVELGLVELERSSATVRCTIIGQEKVELERSRAFLAYNALYEEALRFLSEQEQPTSAARAA